MIKEYALQPELLSSGSVCLTLAEKFGYGIGRVIAQYPERWAERVKMVYDSLDHCMPREKKRMKVGIIRLLSALSPRYYEWDEAKAWLDNAIEEHSKRPFSAIIAQDNPKGMPAVICVDNLYEDEEPRWRTETQRHIERTATEMAACAKFLLQTAREILFVDPHFNPQPRRFKRPLKAFLQAAAQRHPSMPKINRIELHTGHGESKGTKDFFKAECEKHLPAIIPKGMKTRLVRWDQEPLHNRCILTDKGGLAFETGLDDHNGGNKKEDDVFLLARETYEIRWKQYQRDSPIFPLIEDELIVEGTASR